MSTPIDQVREFAIFFQLPLEDMPRFPVEPSEVDFRIDRLEDEVQELITAYEEDDMVGAFDALIDLVYIAYGTALRFGITPAQWSAGFDAVHRANMAKVKTPSARASKFGNSHDIIKPQGWVGPEAELKKILGR